MTATAPAVEQAPAPQSRRLIVGLLAFCSFTVVFNMLIITPLLKDIAEDFGVGVGVAGLLITVYALSAGIVSFFAAPLVDRLGRRRVLLYGISTVAVGTTLSATAPNLWVLMLFRVLAGLGVAALQPAVFAAVGDYFPYKERARAVGWIITANTAASVLGVPAGAVVAQFLSWRLTFVLLGAITGAAALLIARRFPRHEALPAAAAVRYRADYAAIFRNHLAVAVLAANVLGFMSWFAWVTYMGAFFKDEFDVSTGALAPLVATTGLGILVGSVIGGRLSYRLGMKPLIVTGSLLAAPLIVVVSGLTFALWFAALMNFVYAVPGGIRFTGSNTLATEVSPERRGTFMAINASVQQFGIVIGSALGGLAVTVGGYAALGAFVGVTALMSGLVTIRYVDERAIVVPKPAPAGA